MDTDLSFVRVARHSPWVHVSTKPMQSSPLRLAAGGICSFQAPDACLLLVRFHLGENYTDLAN